MQAHESIMNLRLANGWGEKHRLFVKWKYTEANVWFAVACSLFIFFLYYLQLWVTCHIRCSLLSFFCHSLILSFLGAPFFFLSFFLFYLLEVTIYILCGACNGVVNVLL